MYDIIPNKYVAKKARYAMTEKIKNSIIYLLRECSNKLKTRCHQIKFACSILKKMDRVPPRMYYLHHVLQTAMRSQSVPATKKNLFKLIAAICSYVPPKERIVVSTINNSDWERFSVAEAIRLAREDCNQIAEINPILGNELSIANDAVGEALKKIAQCDMTMFDEIVEQVSIIKLFEGKVTMGFTDVRILGAMFIRVPRLNLDPVPYFFEHIIHEASHIHLNCLMVMDPLILNAPEDRFTSPLRGDPRPMIGVFHATYVSARIARSLIKWYTHTGSEYLLHPLAETLDEVLRGILEIEKHAKLTQSGLRLITDIKHFLDAATAMPEWKKYDFSMPRTHRFGVGTTKVAMLQSMVR